MLIVVYRTTDEALDHEFKYLTEHVNAVFKYNRIKHVIMVEENMLDSITILGVSGDTDNLKNFKPDFYNTNNYYADCQLEMTGASNNCVRLDTLRGVLKIIDILKTRAGHD